MSSTGLRVRCLASTRITEQADWEKELGYEDRSHKSERSTSRAVLEEEVDLDNSENVEEEDSGRRDANQEQHKDDDQDASSSVSESDADSDDDSLCSSSNAIDDSSPVVATTSRKFLSCIQEAQLSPDGTCIFTTDYDRTFSVYPIDTNILEESGTRALKAYAQCSSSDPIWAFAANPLFDLNNASSTHVLISRRDRYITLHNALWDMSRPYDSSEASLPKTGPVDISTQLAGYKLIDHLTEAVTAPTSLTYSYDGAHFFAGGQNKISIFDLEYTENPTFTISTIPSKRNKLKGGGRGFKGHISALALSPPSSSTNSGLLAAGARTRYIGIYNAISGQEVTHLSLPGTLNGKKIRNEKLAGVVGDGVSFVKWSPCSKYLYVSERQSDVLLIYDVRNFSLALGHCAGRKALTKQKLGFDVWSAGSLDYESGSMSHEIWAGGTDGKIRVWKDPCLKEGAIEADEVVETGRNAPVVGTLVHPYGSLTVTASGLHQFDEGKLNGAGNQRGGGIAPKFREWGCLDVFGLGAYDPLNQ